MAGVVDNMLKATAYIKERRFKLGLQASLVCYARAVEGPGWEAMAEGASSPAKAAVASNWTGTGPHGMRLKFQRMGILVFLSVATLAFLIPRKENTAHRVTVVIAGTVLVCSLALIRRLDRPFSGVLKINPTAMSITEGQITADFDEAYGEKLLPCNKRGEPLDKS